VIKFSEKQYDYKSGDEVKLKCTFTEQRISLLYGLLSTKIGEV